MRPSKNVSSTGLHIWQIHSSLFSLPLAIPLWKHRNRAEAHRLATVCKQMRHTPKPCIKWEGHASVLSNPQVRKLRSVSLWPIQHPSEMKTKGGSQPYHHFTSQRIEMEGGHTCRGKDEASLHWGSTCFLFDWASPTLANHQHHLGQRINTWFQGSSVPKRLWLSKSGSRESLFLISLLHDSKD